MKKVLLILFAFIYANVILSNTFYSGKYVGQNEIEYRYGVYKLSKRKYINKLRINVESYLKWKMKFHGWSGFCYNEFVQAYKSYICALDDPNKPYRFYSDDFGTLVDIEGRLNNIDSDNSWYDKKWKNKITDYEYNRLKDKKKKKYKQFPANREVATYFNVIALDMIKKGDALNLSNQDKQNKESEFIGW